MDTTALLSIVGLIVLAGIILYFYISSEKCVVCGRRHWRKSDVYHCEQCGKAFCKQGAGLSESNSLTQSGPLTSISMSSGTSMTTNQSCGVVHNQITQGVQTVHTYCRNHIP